MPDVETVRADQIKVGDKICRQKDGKYETVVAIAGHGLNVWLTLQDASAWGGFGGRRTIRPARNAGLWRVTS